MELSVLIEPVNGTKFRASCGHPFQSSVEADSRDEAMALLKKDIVQQIKRGAEVVNMRIEIHPAVKHPILPDDDITKEWMRELARIREASRLEPDPVI